MDFAAIQLRGHFLGFKLSARQVQRCHFAWQGRARAVKHETVNQFSGHQSLELLYKRVLTQQHSAGVVKGTRPGKTCSPEPACGGRRMMEDLGSSHCSRR